VSNDTRQEHIQTNIYSTIELHSCITENRHYFPTNPIITILFTQCATIIIIIISELKNLEMNNNYFKEWLNFLLSITFHFNLRTTQRHLSMKLLSHSVNPLFDTQLST